MSTAAPARTWAVTIGRYLPGLVLLLVVGVVGTFAQTGLRSIATATGARLPDVEYVLWAIVIGLVIRNTVGVPAVFRPGVASRRAACWPNPRSPASATCRSGRSCSASRAWA